MLLSNDEGAINLEKAPAPAPLLLKLGTVLTLLFAPLLTGLVYAAHSVQFSEAPSISIRPCHK